MIGILPKLTKGYILERVSEIDIFEKFLPISRAIIYKCLNENHLIRSPLRKDNNPTCGFFVARNNQLYFNDLAGYFFGDCFEVVGYRNFLNCNNSVDFNKVLHIVAKAFGLHQYAKSDAVFTSTKENIEWAPVFTYIQCFTRNWNFSDSSRWVNFNISLDRLNKYQVYPARKVLINNHEVYNYYNNDPCYAYYLGVDNENRQLWKLYFPEREKFRFITNCNVVQGLQGLVKAEIGLITKSLKDVMSLDSFGVNSVSVPAENHLFSQAQIDYLYSKWSVIYTLFDFDYAGIQLANKYKRVYGIKPLFFTNGKFGSFNFEVKDFAEHVDGYGVRKTQQLISFLKEEDWNNYNFEINLLDFLNYQY